jgi:hypothetical protein
MIKRKINISGLNAVLPIGTWWTVEHIRGGRIIDRFEQGNVCTNEGLADLMAVGFVSGDQKQDWNILLFEDDYTPLITNTYAAKGFTECSAYDEIGRPWYSPSVYSTTGLSNSGDQAVFTMNATKTIYGAALVGGLDRGVSDEYVFSITAFSDYSGTVPGTVLVTATGHGCVTGDIVSIESGEYVDWYLIVKVDDNSFYIYETYTDTDTGDGYNMLTYKKLDSSGNYSILFASSKFASSKSVISTDVLNITCTIMLADT